MSLLQLKACTGVGNDGGVFMSETLELPIRFGVVDIYFISIYSSR